MTSARIRFLALAVGSLAALALLAAHVSPQWKFLGLFPLAVGAAAGASVALLGERNGLARRAIVFAAALLAPAALAGYAAESYRAWRHAKADETAANLMAQPGGKLILDDVRSGRPGRNEVEEEFLAVYRRRMCLPPSVYLTERLRESPVEAGMPWAAVIAAGELISGWAAGIAAAALLSGRPAGRGDMKPEASR